VRDLPHLREDDVVYRAVVWTGINTVEIEQRSLTSPGPGEVLLQLRAAGICGTDLHLLSGTHPQAKPPLVPGHEFTGVVHGVGEGVDPSLKGVRVGADSYRGCGNCLFCASDNPQLCERGTTEYGINIDGGWQEYLVVPEKNLYVLPDSVSFVEAGAGCILNCPMAAVEMVHVQRGESVLILGDGPSSLVMLQLFRLRGAGSITVSGHRDVRLNLARKLGADSVVNTHKDELATALGTRAGTFDVVVDAVGTSETLTQALILSGKRARVHLFGLPESPLTDLPMDEFLWKELTMTGSTGAPALWPSAMEQIQNGSLRVLPIISHRFTLDKAQEAVEYILNNQSKIVKAVFEMA
jgi:L-gulonate 5-dehydrogenase